MHRAFCSDSSDELLEGVSLGAILCSKVVAEGNVRESVSIPRSSNVPRRTGALSSELSRPALGTLLNSQNSQSRMNDDRCIKGVGSVGS